ncbi:MAG: hypothetical protein U0790_00280 [Isosphaeraceae bacterium]
MSRHVPIPASWLAYRPPGVAIGLALYRGLCVPGASGPRSPSPPCPSAGGPGDVAPGNAVDLGPGRSPACSRASRNRSCTPGTANASTWCRTPAPASMARTNTTRRRSGPASRCGRVRPWTDCYCPQCGNPEFATPVRPKARPKALSGGH